MLTHPIRVKQIHQGELEDFVLEKYGEDNFDSISDKNEAIDNLDLYGRGFTELTLDDDIDINDGDSGAYHVTPDQNGRVIKFADNIPGKIFFFINKSDSFSFEVEDSGDNLIGTVFPNWGVIVVGGSSSFGINLIPNNTSVSFSKSNINAKDTGFTNLLTVPGGHVFIFESLTVTSQVENVSETFQFKVTSEGEGLDLTSEHEVPLGPSQPYNFKSNQYFAKENADVIDEGSTVDFEVTSGATGDVFNVDVVISGFFKKKDIGS